MVFDLRVTPKKDLPLTRIFLKLTIFLVVLHLNLSLSNVEIIIFKKQSNNPPILKLNCQCHSLTILSPLLYIKFMLWVSFSILFYKFCLSIS